MVAEEWARMVQLSAEVMRTESGRYKVYWSWASATGFGAGPNLKYETVRGQPRYGFDTYETAFVFASNLPKTPAYRLGNGRSIPERLVPTAEDRAAVPKED